MGGGCEGGGDDYEDERARGGGWREKVGGGWSRVPSRGRRRRTRRRYGGEAPGVARVIALKLPPCKNTPSKRVPTRRARAAAAASSRLISSRLGFSAIRSRKDRRVTFPAAAVAVDDGQSRGTPTTYYECAEFQTATATKSS